jgi:uncharacterized integral membrane protein (TIGR00698 family)
MRQGIFIVCLILTLHPFVSGALALVVGITFALAFGNPFQAQTKKITPWFLQIAIVCLGFSMNLAVVAKVGSQGIAYTAAGIGLTLAVGILLGRLLTVNKETSVLLSVGTAICGGSAIAAVAPVIRAKDEAISISLATVFLLNALALLIFPEIGHWARLTQSQFGLLSALAVHDTSSVVGTSMQFGTEALEIATTVKLARALWIVPVTFVIGALWKHPRESTAKTKPKYPWFILGFLVAAALYTWIPELNGPGRQIAFGGRRLLVLTLFFIGAGMTRSTLKVVGFRPLLHGLILWIFVTGATLFFIRTGLIAIGTL